MSLKTICPICDQDIEIVDDKIRHAQAHLSETNNLLLAGCPNCCRSLVLPTAALKAGENDDWLECLPLDVQLVQEPNGVIDYQGEKLWQPGDGGTGLRMYAYMFAYGVDPQCMWAKMKGGPK